MDMMDPGQYNKRYHRYLIQFMSFRDAVQYDNMQMFSEDELNTVVPGEIKKWMQFKVFGVPVEEVANGAVFLIRSTTLEVMKKSISWYKYKCGVLVPTAATQHVQKKLTTS